MSCTRVPDPAQATVQLRSAREAMDLDTASLIFGHGVPASPTLRGAVRVRRRRCPLPALAAACSSRVRPGEDAEGVVVRCWVPTSRCRARLTLRSPPTRTRSPRALSLVILWLGGTPQLRDGLRRIISSLAGIVRIQAGANSISSFSSNDSLGRPHLHSPSLACRVSIIKKPYSSKRDR